MPEYVSAYNKTQMETAFGGVIDIQNAAAVISAEFPDWTSLDTATNIKVGRAYGLTSGVLGSPETVKIVAAGTYAADGVLVRNLTASGLQAVSTRQEYASYAEAKADPRTFTSGTFWVPSLKMTGQYVSTGDNWGQTTAGGSKVYANAIRAALVTEFGAVGDGLDTSAAANDAAFASAMAASNRVQVPAGTFKLSSKFTMATEGLVFEGQSKWNTALAGIAGFSDAMVIDVNGARLQSIRDILVYGGAAYDAITITNGQLTSLEDIVVKTGLAGVRLISGNSQRWNRVFAESCATGILVIPDSGDNTNGCEFNGIRAYNCTSWGVDIQQGAGANGHMHSRWDASAESNANGIRTRGGRYCHYEFYSEANTGTNFDLDQTVANFYFTKAPDNDSFNGNANFGVSQGIFTTGLNIYQDRGIFAPRTTVQNFAASGSLAGNGIETYFVTNSSGSTRGMTLSFLSYLPVGWKATVVKTDNTAGFTLSPPSGITLKADTGTFGAFPTSIAMMTIWKDSATTAVVWQQQH